MSRNGVSMHRLTIRRLASGGVITNYHCVSRCGHCLYNCGPHREKDYLAPAASERIFSCSLQVPIDRGKHGLYAWKYPDA